MLTLGTCLKNFRMRHDLGSCDKRGALSRGFRKKEVPSAHWVIPNGTTPPCSFLGRTEVAAKHVLLHQKWSRREVVHHVRRQRGHVVRPLAKPAQRVLNPWIAIARFHCRHQHTKVTVDLIRLVLSKQPVQSDRSFLKLTHRALILSDLFSSVMGNRNTQYRELESLISAVSVKALVNSISTLSAHCCPDVSSCCGAPAAASRTTRPESMAHQDHMHTGLDEPSNPELQKNTTINSTKE